jgi:hypothetical protein
MNSETGFLQHQRVLASNWGKFGDIVHDYLEISNKNGACAINSDTETRTGIAAHESGIVCTSFVDGVMKRYVNNDSEEQPDSCRLGDVRDIFDAYDRSRLREDIEPRFLRSVVNRIDQLYGVVFHMKDAWIKNGALRPPGSWIHVGFLAFKDTTLFLIHAQGRRGAQIVSWQSLLIRHGPDLERFGGDGLRGPKTSFRVRSWKLLAPISNHARIHACYRLTEQVLPAPNRGRETKPRPV